MAREIINEFVPSTEDQSQMVFSYGWDLEVERPIAIVEINTKENDKFGTLRHESVSLDWGALCNLNIAVRRAMRDAQKKMRNRG